MSQATKASNYKPKVSIKQYILSEDKPTEETPEAPESPSEKESKFTVRSVALLTG